MMSSPASRRSGRERSPGPESASSAALMAALTAGSASAEGGAREFGARETGAASPAGEPDPDSSGAAEISGTGASESSGAAAIPASAAPVFAVKSLLAAVFSGEEAESGPAACAAGQVSPKRSATAGALKNSAPCQDLLIIVPFNSSMRPAPAGHAEANRTPESPAFTAPNLYLQILAKGAYCANPPSW